MCSRSRRLLNDVTLRFAVVILPSVVIAKLTNTNGSFDLVARGTTNHTAVTAGWESSE